jgi:predicted aspartyl protease
MDEHGRVWLPITVRGNRGETTLEAVVDLGFTETMVLPIEIAAPLGLELTSSIPLELADGRIQTFFLFAAIVVVGDLEVPVDIIVTERGDTVDRDGAFADFGWASLLFALTKERSPFQSLQRKPFVLRQTCGRR